MKTQVWLLSLVLSTQAGAALLVNTTFEAGSAGPGTWSTGAWLGQIDPASGKAWAKLGNGSADVLAGVGQPEGSQAGVYRSTGAIGGVHLYYGDGKQNGIYKITHSAKVVQQSTNILIPVLRFGNESSNKWAFAMRMIGYGDGTYKIQIQHSSESTYWDAIPRYTAKGDVWYDFEYIVDVQNRTLDIKIKESSSATWQAVKTNMGFVHPNQIPSLDQFKAYADATGINLYLDNLKVEVIPEPATMILLGIGGALILRRLNRV